MARYFAFLGAFFLALSMIEAYPPHMCLKPSVSMRTHMETCFSKLNIDMKAVGRPEENNYDDKCFKNCVFTEAKLVDSNGDVIDDAFSIYAKQKAEDNGKPSDQYVKDCMACLADARKNITTEGGVAKAPCKFAAMFSSCIHRAEAKICGDA